MGVNKFNSEGYFDPTPYEALKNIERELNNQNKAYKNQIIQKNNQNKGHKNQRNQRKNQRVHFKIIYVCSPLRGDMERNMKNACKYCRFVVTKGYIPLAVHLLFPQFMNDNNKKERQAAISMGAKLLAKCDELWCFGLKISDGMAAELSAAKELGIKIRAFNDKCEEVIVE